MSPPLLALVILSFLPGEAAPTPAFPDVPAASVTLGGRVVEATSRTPLSGAQVHVVGTGLGAVTNVGGRYSILLPAGFAGREVIVQVGLIGYARVDRSLTLSEGANLLDVELEAQALARDEVLVRASSGEVATAARQAPVAYELSGKTVRFAAGAAPVLRGRYNPDFNTEDYALIRESGFLAPTSSPLSTFSIDVDRASYSNVRRFIRDGMRPPVDAVRIEELINYFPYDDPEPSGSEPFSITTEVAPAPWQPLHRLVRIGLKGRGVDMEEAPPSNLVFLLDVSGSMNSPDKLPLLKRSLALLVDQLRPRDRVAIVVYAGAAGLVLPSTPGSDRATILDALNRLHAGGSTAGGAGLRLAYEVAAKHHITGGNNRVILATDGDFNVGASSDAEMVRLIEEKREQGTFLTVLGFGTGNLKDAKMEQIADHGNGNFAYIDGLLEARKVLVSEMGGTLLTIAKDVKIQVEFNPARVAAYRLIGYENRLMAAEDFADDTKDAGEMGAGHSVTALYEVVPVGVESPVVVHEASDLRYRQPTDVQESAGSDELLYVKLRYKEPDGRESRLLSQAVGDHPGRASADLRFAGAVAAWGMLLRDSEHCAGFTLADVEALASGALGADPEGYRAEFLTLVRATRTLELLSHQPGS